MEDDGWQPCLDEAPWWLDSATETEFDDAVVCTDPGFQLSPREILLEAERAGPGPAAQCLLASLAGRQLSQDQWLTCVQLWETQEAWLVGQKALAVLGFAGPEPVTVAGFRDDEALTLELALGVGCSEGFAHSQIAAARLLSSTLSRTGDLLRAGQLSPYRARIIVGELGHLHPDVAQRVEGQVLDTATTVPTGSLRSTLARKVKKADRRAARDMLLATVVDGKGRRVEFDPEPVPFEGIPDGLMGMYAYLPPVEALAIRNALQQSAGPYRKSDGRLHDERMADALTGMVLGFDPDHPGAPVKPKVKVGLLIDLPTLLGLRDNDGELLGYGHLPAEVVRELTANASWQRLVYDPVTGYLLDAGTQVHDLPALSEFIPLRDRRDRFPGGTRTTGFDLDHAKPFGATTEAKPKPADSGPFGEAPATAAAPADTAPDEPMSPTVEDLASSTVLDAGAEATLPIDPLAASAETPGVDGGTTAASPPTEAATVTTVGATGASLARDRGSPDVAAPAEGATQPEEGGRTAADNLAALSRRHHRAKTFLGFGYRHLGLGVLEWTTPLGRRYRTYPHDYRPEGGGSDPPP